MRLAVPLLVAVAALPAAAGLVAAFVLGLDGGAWSRVFATPGIGLSIASALWSGSIATILALGLAHVAVALAATGGWRRRLNALTLPLLAMPHLAVGIGLALVIAPSGLLMRMLSPWASGFDLPPDWHSVNDPAALSLIAGLVLKETAFLVLALVAALAQIRSSDFAEQATTLGYGRLKGWFVVVAPQLQRQIRLPLAAVLVFGITNVEMAIPLGPGLPPTFPVLLWQWFTDPDPAVGAQAYAGTLLLVATTVAVLVTFALVGTGIRALLRRSAENGRRRQRDGALRSLIRVVLAIGASVGALTVVAILIRAMAGPWRFPAVLPGDGASTAWRAALSLSSSVAPMTLALAGATALVGLVLVLPAAEACRHSFAQRRRVGSLLFLPLLVPQLTFLFGVQVLLVRLQLDGTFMAVLWTHLIFALPYLWGFLAYARASLDPRYAAVAATLGASRWSAWRGVTAPLLLRSALIASAVAFSVSVALYLPTLFAGAGRIATAATEAAAAAGSGNLRLAAIYALTLAAAPLAAFATAYAASALLFRNRRGMPA